MVAQNIAWSASSTWPYLVDLVQCWFILVQHSDNLGPQPVETSLGRRRPALVRLGIHPCPTSANDQVGPIGAEAGRDSTELDDDVGRIRTMSGKFG